MIMRRDEEFDKRFDRQFAIASILGIMWILILMTAVGVGIFLAIKNWG